VVDLEKGCIGNLIILRNSLIRGGLNLKEAKYKKIIEENS
jgi:hypothetical protein